MIEGALLAMFLCLEHVLFLGLLRSNQLSPYPIQKLNLLRLLLILAKPYG